MRADSMIMEFNYHKNDSFQRPQQRCLIIALLGPFLLDGGSLVKVWDLCVKSKFSSALACFVAAGQNP